MFYMGVAKARKANRCTERTPKCKGAWIVGEFVAHKNGESNTGWICLPCGNYHEANGVAEFQQKNDAPTASGEAPNRTLADSSVGSIADPKIVSLLETLIKEQRIGNALLKTLVKQGREEDDGGEPDDYDDVEPDDSEEQPAIRHAREAEQASRSPDPQPPAWDQKYATMFEEKYQYSPRVYKHKNEFDSNQEWELYCMSRGDNLEVLGFLVKR